MMSRGCSRSRCDRRGRRARRRRVGAGAPGAVRVSRRAERRSLADACPPIDAFVQREPNDGGEPSQRTEFRVAYDATTLFVKVRAFDTEPDKIVTYLTRRDVDSPCDWIRVLIDSYHDQRTAYEFARQPVRRQDGPLLVQRQQPRRQLGRGVGRQRLARRAGLVGRVPDSVFAAAIHPAATNTFGFAVSRQIGRLNETSTWPLLSRSANGYVSSFGELGGLSMDASPKRLELLPYTVAERDAPADRRQPADRSIRRPGAALGLDVKYALTSGLTLTTRSIPISARWKPIRRSST